MAKSASITRRDALSAAAAFSLPVATLPVAVNGPTIDRDSFGYRAFVEQVACWHSRGKEVAIRALEAGAVPRELKMVDLVDNAVAPTLLFNVPGRPDREIVVNAQTAYIHGPVRGLL